MSAAPLRLRLLTLNIQGGLAGARYSHYLTDAWRHLVPHRRARLSLARIARLARGFDLVALQEADAGSLRTAQLNQVAHLAELGGFPHWHAAVTRELWPFARHCLGLLSRWPLESVRYHTLPGWLPGRGALELQVGPPGHEPLRVIVVHLALTRRARATQLERLAELAQGPGDTVVLGDFNCGAAEMDDHGGLGAAGLRAVHGAHTFPSWRPTRSLDHILVSAGVTVVGARVLDDRLSDHRPVAAELDLRLAFRG